MDQNKKHDKFCWECCETETTLECSTCLRSFHPKCTPNETDITNSQEMVSRKWCCSVCKKIQTATNKKEELWRIPAIFNRVYSSKCVDSIRTNKRGSKRMRLSTEFEDGDDDIVNPIDLDQIKFKADSKECSKKYNSLDEFLIDFQWLAHNYEIMYTNNDDKTNRAKKLLNLVSAEIDSVKTCLQCHINANKHIRWFTMVHHLPHLIIWAYRKNTKYWPAKVMSYDEHHVNVRFFGGYHKHENVPVNRCFLYSKDSPTNNFLKSNDTEFKSALKEADEYIKNIRAQYGDFQLAEAKTKFDPSKFDEYIQNLISAVGKLPERRKSAQSGEINASNLEDSMESTNGNLSTSIKPGPSVTSSDLGESSNGNSKNGEHDTDKSIRNGSDDGSETNDDDDMNSMSGYSKSLKHFTEGFDRICRENTRLNKRVMDLEKNLKESNSKLMDENVKLKIEMKNRIKALKETHNQEMTQLKEEHQKLIEQQKQTIEQCKREYLKRIEKAKSNSGTK